MMEPKQYYCWLWARTIKSIDIEAEQNAAHDGDGM